MTTGFTRFPSRPISVILALARTLQIWLSPNCRSPSLPRGAIFCFLTPLAAHIKWRDAITADAPRQEDEPVTAPLRPHAPIYPWEVSYLGAILETDDSVLQERIREAERVVTQRLVTLPDIQENEDERQALERALEGIAKLQRERLNRLEP